MDDTLITDIKQARVTDPRLVEALISVIGDSHDYAHLATRKSTLLSIYDFDDLDLIQFIMTFEKLVDCCIPDVADMEATEVWIMDKSLGEIQDFFLNA